MNGIFVSYRRSDAGGYAGRLRDHLSTRFPDVVFQDVDDILDGEIFSQAIERNLADCRIGLVVIGPTWVSCRDEAGNRRLDDPGDWVRLEVASLLRRNIRVVPVLVGGAKLPDRAELPEELRPLLDRAARELRDTAWESDVALLVKNLHAMLPEADTGRQPGTTPGRSSRSKLWITIGGLVVLAIVGVVVLTRNYPRSNSNPTTDTAVSSEAATQKAEPGSKTNPSGPSTTGVDQHGKGDGASVGATGTKPEANPAATEPKKAWWDADPSYVAKGDKVAEYGSQLGLTDHLWKREQDGAIFEFTRLSSGGLDFRQIKPPVESGVGLEHVERIERFGPGDTAWPKVRVVVTWDTGMGQTSRAFTFLAGVQELTDCVETILYSTRSEVNQCNDTFKQESS